MKLPSSPLALGFSIPSGPPSPTSSNSPTQPHRNMTSRSNLRDSPSPCPVPVTLSGGEPSGSVTTPSPQSSSENVNSTVPALHSRPSVHRETASIHSNHTNVISLPPTVACYGSLRSKLSLLNLRCSFSHQDDTPSLTSGTQGLEGDTIQVQDTDFELVRPNIPQFQASRSSVDSGIMGRETSIDVRQDHLRSESPAVAVSATNNIPRSPLAPVLLFDSVPPVRYLVWTHLTDCKARYVPRVYSQLWMRGRVSAFANTERNVQ